MIYQIALNIFILYIWFQTDAFAYYFKQTKYFDYIEEVTKVSYPDFLFINTPNFFTKLLSCLPCFLFWINIITSLYFGFGLFFINFLLSLIIYKLVCRVVQS